MAARRSKSRNASKAIREFVSEAEEILEGMRTTLADLTELESGSEADPELVNQVFRCAHSLKGVAGMFGFDAVSELAHHLEDLLDGLRMGRLALDPTVLELLDESVTLLTQLVAGVSEGGQEPELEAEVRGLVERLQRGRTSERETAPAFEALAIDPSLLRALTEYEEHRLRENLRRGRRIHLVEATFEILAFEEGLSELTHAVREVGEVISTLPAPGAAPESQIRFTLLVASDLGADELEAHLDSLNASVRCVHGGTAPAAAAAEVTTASSPTQPRPAAAPAPPRGELESLRSISETVRVDIRKLDELMNQVGELVIQRGALAAVARRLLAEPATARVGDELLKIHKAIDRKLQELQAGVLDVRMVPLRQVFEKLARVVRRLQRDLGKSVRLEMIGADTELDKLIVEELANPLMHVVRNAFDHAIEPAEERARLGKPPEGCIRLAAFQRGNHVVIEVSDDGRGIDPERIRARAIERGLIAPEDAPSRKELLDLVFAPGFSTRDEVTETSGRGVGMDVVRTSLASLGGLVDLESEPGRGTTVSFTLPITLAIIQALIVAVGEHRFALPLTSVLETLIVEPERIHRSQTRELLNLRGHPLTLFRLSRAFGLPEPPSEAKQYVVVIGFGDARFGLVVDRVEGQQDAVIKPIQGPVRRMRGVAGATESGDWGTVLVLDVAALVEDAFRTREAA